MGQAPVFLLDQLVARAAAWAPEAPALRMHDVRLTYGELETQVQRAAAGLVAAGARPGDRIGLYLPKSIEAVTALLAILRVGAAYVPVDPQAPAERARFVLEHCGVEILLSAGRPLKQIAKAGKKVARTLIVPDGTTIPACAADSGLRWSALTTPDDPPPSPARSDQDLAYVLYTSGSTGRPKGVAITHGQSLAFVRTATETFGLRDDDVVAAHAPFNFDLSIIDLFCGFAAGAQVVLVPEAWTGFPAKVASLISDAGITVWNSVPSALIALAQRGQLEDKDVSALRIVMFAGEPFPLPALRTLRAAVPSATLYNVYGQTEANSSTFHRIDEIPADGDPLPIGRPFANYQVLLVDEQGARIDEPLRDGELHVVGAAVASGYYRDEATTKGAFVQHPLQTDRPQTVYRTGDRACWDSEGRLIFRGRSDLAVKVRGFRVELGEIETVARECADVDEVCAAAVPDAELGHTLVLFVAGADGGSVDDDALRAHLAETLPRYMRPERLVCRASLPRTSTGKIDRAGLVREAKALLQEG